MTRYPKVVFVAGTLGMGGAERQLYLMVRELAANGAEPEVVTLTQGEHWSSALADLGVPLHYVGRSGSRLVRTLVIIRLLRRLRPEVVQSSHTYPNFYAAVGAKFSRARSLGAVREDVATLERNLGRFTARASLALPWGLVVNSRKAMDDLRARGRRHRSLFHLPNVVDTDRFAPASRTDRASEFVLLAVGRLDINKHHDRFLRILRRVIDKEPCGLRVRGVILGDGPQRDALLAQSRALGLDASRLTIASTPDTVPHYQTADVLLLTSASEGTPNVVLEAMSVGLPVVSFAVGDVPDIITNGHNGYVLPDGDEEGMLDAALHLLSDPVTRAQLGAAARSTMISNWSLASLGEHMGALYRHVTRRTAG